MILRLYHSSDMIHVLVSTDLHDRLKDAVHHDVFEENILTDIIRRREDD